MTTQETAALLRTYDNVLILTHRRPDGDTIGCASALCIALRQLGRTAYLLYNRETTEHFLPYAQEFWAPEGFTPDHVVSVDIASLSLLPENAEAYRDRIELAIDHHPSFEHFAPQSCVIPSVPPAARSSMRSLRRWSLSTRRSPCRCMLPWPPTLAASSIPIPLPTPIG